MTVAAGGTEPRASGPSEVEVLGGELEHMHAVYAMRTQEWQDALDRIDHLEGLLAAAGGTEPEPGP